MLKHQLYVELKRANTKRNLIIWAGIIILLPFIRFISIKDAYQFFEPIEVFQELNASILPLLFPAIVVFLYLPSFIDEIKNNFIQHTRSRIHLYTYLLSKGLMNAFICGAVMFVMVFFSFLFSLYAVPNMNMVEFHQAGTYDVVPTVTFSQFLVYGNIAYGLIYSMWVALNAIVYATIAYLLILLLNNPFIAISAPFVFYHVFNFVTGVLQIPQFSPLSTIFPFNIQEQGIWTIFIPFTVLMIVLIGAYICSRRTIRGGSYGGTF